MAHDASVDNVDEVTASRPAPTPPHSLRAWRNAVFTVFFLSGLSLASWVARIPAIRDVNELSTQAVGLVILGGSAGSVLGLILSPLIHARVGTRVGEIITLGTVSAGLVAVGIGGSVWPSVPLVLVGLVLVGLGNGGVDVMMNVDGAMAERAIRKTLMPLFHAFFSFGTVAGALIAAGASALGISVAWHLGAIAALILVSVVIAVRFVPRDSSSGDERADASAEARPPLRGRLRANLSVWRDGGLLLIGVIMLSTSFAEGSANDWIALAVVDGHGFDGTTGALVFGVFTVSMTLARVLGGPVLDRFGRVLVLRVCSAAGVAGLALFIFATEPWMLVVGTALWAVGASLGFPVGMSAAADHPTRSAARVSAVAIIGYCAFLAAPPLLGFLGEHYGILNALLVIAGLFVLAGVLAPATREKTRRSAE